MKSSSLNTRDYLRFVANLKARIESARISAARSVNRGLILLYWDIGRGIVEKQEIAGWGDAVVERLASDLRAAFPEMRGFSIANLWRMKQIYLAHTSPEFLAQAVRELEMTRRPFPAQAVPGSAPVYALAGRVEPLAGTTKDRFQSAGEMLTGVIMAIGHRSAPLQ